MFMSTLENGRKKDWVASATTVEPDPRYTVNLRNGLIKIDLCQYSEVVLRCSRVQSVLIFGALVLSVRAVRADRAHNGALVRSGAAVSKRIVAQQIASVYDPLGWFIPLLVKAKNLQQKLWKERYEWDQPLSDNHAAQWSEIVKDISGYQHKLPRRIVHRQSKHTIVTFSDASAMAMAACAYLTNEEEANFLMAKSKIANAKKPVTIPKMELNAIAIAARLTNNILLSIRTLLQVERVLILCDSEIALNWLQSSKHRQNTGKYVSNRIKEIYRIVREIEGLSINVQIGYVDTKRNPADCATRGLSSSEFSNHNWWKGYTLKEIHTGGFVSKLVIIQEEDGEPETVVTSHVTVTTKRDEAAKEIVELSAYNELRKVRRIVAYALRLVKGIHRRLQGALKEKLQTSLPWITHEMEGRNVSATEVKDAEIILIKQHQAVHLRSHYRKELVKNLNVREDA
ncbi:hypothetical protein GCK32_009821, partial [Trichostrongylus colubriformis]